MTTPVFRFETPNFPNEFVVVSFTGFEQLSGLFEYKVQLKILNTTTIDEATLIGEEADFIFENTTDLSKNINISGVLSSFEYSRSSLNYHYFKAKLVPKVWESSLGVDYNLFVELTPRETIIEGITNAGLDSVVSTSELSTSASLTSNMLREFTCQYNESNFDFISRIAEHHGIYYYFDHNDSSKLIFADDMAYPASQTSSLSFNNAAGGADYFARINSFKCVNRQAVQHVVVTGYDPAQPSYAITGSAGTQGASPKKRLTDENVSSTEEAEAIAATRLEEMQSFSTVYKGRSGIPALTPGYTFEISGHPRYIDEPELLITSVSHEGNHLDAAGDNQVHDSSYYKNTFRAIPAEKQFRPRRVTAKPVAISERGNVYAEIPNLTRAERDLTGRYRVRFNFIDDPAKDKASYWLRMSQPTGGTEDAFDIPLKADVEVQIGFKNGNPDEPYIQGVMPNAQFPSPVTSENVNLALVGTSGLLAFKADGGFHENIKTNDLPIDNSFLFPSFQVGDASNDATMHEFSMHITPEEEMSGNYLVERSYGDEYEYRDGNSFRFLTNDSEYHIGTSYLERHVRDSDEQLIDYERPGDWNNLHQWEFPTHFKTNADGSIPGLVEKTWGNEFEYRNGTVYAWSDSNDSPNGGGRNINFGCGYTLNFLDADMTDKETDFASLDDADKPDLEGLDWVAQKLNSIINPAKSQEIKDAMEAGEESSNNIYHDITKTSGNTYDFHRGNELNVHVGDTTDVVYGETTIFTQGDSFEHFNGNSNWHFNGGHDSFIAGRATSTHLGYKFDNFVGGLEDMIAGVHLNFELSIGKEFNSTSKIRTDNKKASIAASATEAALKKSADTLSNRLSALDNDIKALNHRVDAANVDIKAAAKITLITATINITAVMIKIG